MDDQIIYGRNPVNEALKQGVDIAKIYMNRELTGEYEITIRKWCKENNIPLSKVPVSKLDQMAKRQIHQGIVAQVAAISIKEIEDIFTEEPQDDDMVVILDGVSDIRNLGAIARSALAFGCKAIIMSTKGSASLNMDAVKSSSGALLKIPVCREKNVMVAIEKLQQIGYTVWASNLKAKLYLHELPKPGPLALVMGSEDRGVSREALKVADDQFKFIQENTIDSLNVSVATGICLYDLYLRRNH
jgi:23S rRNA (guanosine2251-2'-O)-methyltransferase